MPNRRADGRVPITFRASPDFLKAIEEGRKQFRALDRSQFIRDAIAEKLRALGIEYKSGEELRPDRMGKGGPKKLRYQISPASLRLNDPPK